MDIGSGVGVDRGLGWDIALYQTYAVDVCF